MSAQNSDQPTAHDQRPKTPLTLKAALLHTGLALLAAGLLILATLWLTPIRHHHLDTNHFIKSALIDCVCPALAILLLFGALFLVRKDHHKERAYLVAKFLSIGPLLLALTLLAILAVLYILLGTLAM